MIIDLLEVTGKNFIGRPLKDLNGRTGYNRAGFLLFLDDGDKHVKLGEDFSIERILKRNEKYSDYTISKIERYYDQISVRIVPPEENDVYELKKAGGNYAE